jgi:hypothetical protein
VAAAADIERQSLKSVPSLDLLSPISSSGASFIREMQGQNIPACVMTCSPAARSWSSPSAAASGDSRHTQREREEAQPARQRSRRGGGAGTVWPAQVGLGAGGRSSGAPSCPSHRHKVSQSLPPKGAQIQRAPLISPELPLPSLALRRPAPRHARRPLSLCWLLPSVGSTHATD